MKKKLKKKIDLILSLAIIVVMLPLFVTILMQKMQLETLLAGSNMETVTETEAVVSAAEQTEGSVSTVEQSDESKAATELQDRSGMSQAEAENVESKLVGIVAREINAGANQDALLAQCVIARTNLYDAKNSKTVEPEALTMEEMQNLWGESFQEIYRSLQNCVSQTKNQVLTWQKKPIYAAYHAVSAGKTRNMSDLYADAKMPYLVENPCSEDTSAEGYLAVVYLEEQEFLEKCRSAFPGQTVESCDNIVIASRDEADYVKEVQLGTGTCTGEEFRSALGLNSACFSINYEDGKVRIVTKGIGHGLGLSQYTANLMAAQGESYQEILAYFYPGTELTEISVE